MGEEHDRRRVASWCEVDHDASLRIREHRRVDVVLLHAALVDGEVAPESATALEEGLSSLLSDSEAQVVLRDAEVDGGAPRRPSPLQVCEETECALARTAASDPLESLVEASLGTVLELTDKAAYADRQRDDEGAYDVDHVAPPRTVRRRRGSSTARAECDWVAPRHVNDRATAFLVNGAKDSHVAPSKTQVDTVGHGPWLLCSIRSEPKLGSPGPPQRWMLTEISASGSTLVREEPIGRQRLN